MGWHELQYVYEFFCIVSVWEEQKLDPVPVFHFPVVSRFPIPVNMDRIRHTAFIIYSHCYITGAGKSYTHQSMFWSDLGPDVGYEAIGKYYYLPVFNLI